MNRKSYAAQVKEGRVEPNIVPFLSYFTDSFAKFIKPATELILVPVADFEIFGTKKELQI